MELLGCYCSIAVLWGFFLCGWDKHCAQKGKSRVPERTLFLVAAIGGAAGVWLSMYVFRHKTQHKKFVFGVPALLLLQILAGIVIWRLLA